jgi:hypothetical protein
VISDEAFVLIVVAVLALVAFLTPVVWTWLVIG